MHELSVGKKLRGGMKHAAVRTYSSLLRFRAIHHRLLYLASDPKLLKPNGRSGLYLIELPAAGGRTYRMALQRPGAIEDRLIQDREWEPQMRSLIAFFLKPNGIFVDIGANIGPYALYMAASRPDCACICFEPCPGIYDQLARNVRLSRLSNVALHNIAAGETSAEVEFFAQTKTAYNRGLSSLRRNYDLGDDFQKITVRQVDLDSFFDTATKERISVIKIDTQGSELSVLRGLKSTIAQYRPVVIFEFVSDYVDDPYEEISEMLRLFQGYDAFKINPNFPELEAFEPAEVRAKGFWSDIICIPDSVL